MAYTDSRGFTDSQDNQKSFNEKYVDNDPGPYLATVKTAVDPLRMGRLGVNIPALTNTIDPKPAQITWCQYLSPFYGVKSLKASSTSDPYSFKDTQQSYGLWAVPPDIDTTVLVIFAKGENQNANAFWMGCVQDPMTNQMVPGNGSTDKTRVAANNTDFSQNKQELYGTDVVPAGEKNRNMFDPGDTIESADKWNYPINDALADQLQSQGLVQDTVRGTTTSSARRESPSRVFGWNTPGRLKEDGTPRNIGIGGSPELVERETGHSFVMDDGAVDGTNQLTRLRTASGHQLLMNDSEGVVYLANGSGKAFIEMDTDGTVSVYSDGGINLRSGRDFNLHSDMNINFHAKGAINFTSEANVALNAEGYVFAMGEKGILNSSQKGSVRNYARDGITSFTDGTQLHGAGGQIHLAGAQVHMNSIGASSTWGPGWLNPDAIGIKVTKGLIDIDDDNPLPQGKPNKIDTRTTVTDFVTHEPYDRQSSTARTKKYINEVMEEIKKSSPELSATELKLIKSELLKQPSIKAVADKLNKVVKSNDKIKLETDKLNTLISKANEIQKLFNDPQGSAINFVKGFVGSTSGQAFVNNVFRRVKTFFYGESSNPGDRDTFDPTTGR
jgi:hypothetical protein